jgi:hypothetical protein
MTLADARCGENHIYQRTAALLIALRTWPEVAMPALSMLSGLLRLYRNKDLNASDGRQKVLAPRTAADELPPHRGQPWIIDRRGYRKIDPRMTLVPASRL